MPDDLKIDIKTTADVTGVDKAKAAVWSLRVQAKEIGEAYKEAGGGIKGAFASVSQMGGAATSIVAGLVGGLSLAAKAVREWADSEKAVAKLDKALAKNGNLTDEVREKYYGLASQLQATTAVADEKWMAVMTTLTKFGSTPETIQRDVTAVKNLANALDIDLEEAAFAVSKALQGSFEMFGRYGIHLDETATKTEKLTDLFKQLDTIGGGVGKTEKTLSQEWANFTTQSGEALEVLGGLIAKFALLKPIMGSINWWFEKLNYVISSTPDKLDDLKNSTDGTAQRMRAAEAASADFAKELEQIKAKADEGSKSLQVQLSILEKFKTLGDQMADAKLDFDLKVIGDAEKRGSINPLQASAMRFNAQTEAATGKEMRQRSLEFQETIRERDEIKANEARQAQIKDKLKASDKFDQQALAFSPKRNRITALLEERADVGTVPTTGPNANIWFDRDKDAARLKEIDAELNDLMGQMKHVDGAAFLTPQAKTSAQTELKAIDDRNGEIRMRLAGRGLDASARQTITGYQTAGAGLDFRSEAEARVKEAQTAPQGRPANPGMGNLALTASIDQFVRSNGDTNGYIKKAFDTVNQQNAELRRSLDNMKHAFSP